MISVLVRHFEVKHFEPEEQIVTIRDDKDKSLYIISKGLCVVTFDDEMLTDNS